MQSNTDCPRLSGCACLVFVNKCENCHVQRWLKFSFFSLTEEETRGKENVHMKNIAAAAEAVRREYIGKEGESVRVCVCSVTL